MADSGDPASPGNPAKSFRLNLTDALIAVLVLAIPGFFLFLVFDSMTW